MPAAFRRSLFGAAASLAVLPTFALATTSPDAELIAVCGEFIVCDKRQRAIYDGPDAIDDDDEAAAATVPIFARMHVLLDRMKTLKAYTADGIVARAASLAQANGEWDSSFDYPETIPGRLLDYLMRDVAMVGRDGA